MRDIRSTYVLYGVAAIIILVLALASRPRSATPDTLSSRPELLSIAISEAEQQSTATAPINEKTEETEPAEPAQPKPVQKQSSSSTNTPSSTQPATTSQSANQNVVRTPYDLTYTGVATDLSAIGESQSALRASGIDIIGNKGLVPKRCSSGQMSTSYAQGMAIKTPYSYPACPDGGSPVYDAYRPQGYSCSIIYNVNSSKKLAILAHEVAHCKYFQKGQYRAFDINYKQVRSVGNLNRSQLNEVIADDIMICHYGLDTAWGSGSYYSLYGVGRPSSSLCSQVNELVATYL